MNDNFKIVKYQVWTDKLEGVKSRLKEGRVIKQDKEILEEIEKGLRAISDDNLNKMLSSSHRVKQFNTQPKDPYIRDKEREIKQDFFKIWEEIKKFPIED